MYEFHWIKSFEISVSHLMNFIPKSKDTQSLYKYSGLSNKHGLCLMFVGWLRFIFTPITLVKYVKTRVETNYNIFT